ncbi:hypothetical protein DPMN_176539 [Dreissena polymorpha]|uniref:Uncharacterized protein n=1 Tax=Dreissena polymorpha TaxID=45954 RepID=A0A9D4EBH6_DREPO|nr:hypothetical protein DPMN_176539 [Dreissena polymorpha]
MDLLLKQLREQAKKYEGLRIDSYIRQGSAREGLKVLNANEFDTMLEFHIEGLEGRIDHAPITNAAGKSIPGFCKLRIYGVSFERLEKICPRMFKEGVFVQHGDEVYLSSKVLHEKIFESMVDTARHVITTAMQDTSRFLRKASSFRLYRKMNPPAINVTIQLCYNDILKKEIDVDLVPAFQLRKDERTTYEGHQINCPIHAVCKWVGKVERDERLVWDVKTTGYEKHILDMARQSRRKLYIVTALRIVKTYFVKKLKHAKDHNITPPHIVTVLKSYHLKQIAFYLLYYLCHKYPSRPLPCAKTAFEYFLNLLLICLRSKSLPHFFYSGTNVGTMLPGFPQNYGFQLRYNMFQKINDESLARAAQSFIDEMMPELGVSFGVVDPHQAQVYDMFESLAVSHAM